MKEIMIQVTDEQFKAVQAHVINPAEWIQHAWNDKARKCIDRIVEIVSDKQPAKMTDQEKINIISIIKIENATPERQLKGLVDRIII